MADEVTGSDLYFGVDALAAVGVVQSYAENNSAEIAEAKNESGKTIEQRAYSRSKEVSIEALVKKGTKIPDAGTVLTAGTFTGLISTCNVTGSNADYKKMSITATKKDSAVLVPMEATTPVA